MKTEEMDDEVSKPTSWQIPKERRTLPKLRIKVKLSELNINNFGIAFRAG